MVSSIINPIVLYYDNNRVIAQAKEPKFHQKSKYIFRSFYFIREIIEKKYIKIKRVSTKENHIDPLTKALS
jgi:hypothetical protein